MTEELSADELADIRAKAEKASPGRWTREDTEIRDGQDRTIGEMIGPETSDRQDARNAAHVVSAQPATVMRLVDMITTRDARLAALDHECEVGSKQIVVERHRAERAEERLSRRRKAATSSAPSPCEPEPRSPR